MLNEQGTQSHDGPRRSLWWWSRRNADHMITWHRDRKHPCGQVPCVPTQRKTNCIGSHVVQLRNSGAGKIAALHIQAIVVGALFGRHARCGLAPSDHASAAHEAVHSPKCWGQSGTQQQEHDHAGHGLLHCCQGRSVHWLANLVNSQAGREPSHSILALQEAVNTASGTCASSPCCTTGAQRAGPLGHCFRKYPLEYSFA